MNLKNETLFSVYRLDTNEIFGNGYTFDMLKYLEIEKNVDFKDRYIAFYEGLEFACKIDALNYADDNNMDNIGTVCINDSYYLTKKVVSTFAELFPKLC